LTCATEAIKGVLLRHWQTGPRIGTAQRKVLRMRQ
jgi:hypothetical protein